MTPAEVERKLEQLRALAGMDDPPTPPLLSAVSNAEGARDRVAQGDARVRELAAHAAQVEEAARLFGAIVGELATRCAAVLELDRSIEDGPGDAQAPPAEVPDERTEIDEQQETPVAPAPPGGALEGEISLEVGPFADITSVSDFVQTLAGFEGVSDVYVRGFEETNAMLEVRLDGKIDFSHQLVEAMPGRVRVAETSDSRVVVALNPHATAEHDQRR